MEEIDKMGIGLSLPVLYPGNGYGSNGLLNK
jgi:hypothetical protein